MTDRLTILQGDCLEKLATLPDESVHCCVTSPPYWGLRDYGVAGQIGLEKTPEEYVAKMVAVFGEVKRVLREDGTLWLNLGDSYCATTKGSGGHNPKQDSNTGSWMEDRGWQIPAGLKPKDLVGIPWRVAFALQADGWYLRSDIIWHKPNPMPESVTDRPTKAHEYLFLLSKSERYFYDAEAVKEPSIDPESLRPEGRNPRKDDKFAKAFLNENREGFARTRDGFSKLDGVCYPTRNKRTVWTVATSPYSEAHFATFPPDLIKPCILAGTSARGCCPKCGAPWERIVEKVSGYEGARRNDDLEKAGTTRGTGWKNGQKLAELPPPRTIDWKPPCQCFCIEDTPDPIPCTVLDPFGGSGTTGQVALELGRNAVLIELNPKYIPLIESRTNITPGLALA